MALCGVAVIGLMMVGSENDVAGSAMLGGTLNTQTTEPAGFLEADAGTGFGSSLMPTAFKMICALVIVLLLVYGCIYLLKRLSGQRHHGGGRNLLQVIETVHVAPKKTISLVRVAGRSVLVGVTENSMTALTELDQEETSAAIDMDSKTERSEAVGFKEILNNASTKLKEISLGKKRAVA